MTRSHARELFRLVTGEPGLRDVDLIIRTCGEKRLSDFLLWEGAYAELYFTERMWPEFDADDLAEALAVPRPRAPLRRPAIGGTRTGAEPLILIRSSESLATRRRAARSNRRTIRD